MPNILDVLGYKIYFWSNLSYVIIKIKSQIKC